MRQSTMYLPTWREAPAEAEVKSHQLMLRAGLIRQLAAGIYSYLPLGWRVLRNIEQIVREEMERCGAQELLMPALQPAELWRESERYEVYGPELIRLRDRHQREFALGPTHEEVITSLVRNDIKSYKKLPLTLFQIQTKFRDERRPRFGLLRGREFLMKDAYSFHADWEGLERTYREIYNAYQRIFSRCGLTFRPVEADAGQIGGEGSTHEFMALSDIGEDTIAVCCTCDYAANIEKAEPGHARPLIPNEYDSREDHAGGRVQVLTENVKTIDQLTRFFGQSAHTIIKTLFYTVDQQLIAVAVRGDHEVNEAKVKAYLHAEHIALANSEMVEATVGIPLGYAGPVGLSIPVLMDRSVSIMAEAITGANQANYHYKHVKPGRDFQLEQIGDFRNAVHADACPRCTEGTLQLFKGIEIGHVFKLGTKYSEKLNAVYLDEHGKERPMIMGCYGIGVSRLLSAVVEQCHDEKGVVWPVSIAPFHVHLIVVSIQDEVQRKMAEGMYERLRAVGVQALLDDRPERLGVKLNDADLIGIPLQIIIGKQAAQNIVEYKERDNGTRQDILVDDAVERVMSKRT